METKVIGYLIGGKFFCKSCAKDHYPEIVEKCIKVYKENILPYSQQCSRCRCTVVDGVREAVSGKPLSLFDVGEPNIEGFQFQFVSLLTEMRKAEEEQDYEAAGSLEKKLVILYLDAVITANKDAIGYAEKLKRILIGVQP